MFLRDRDSDYQWEQCAQKDAYDAVLRADDRQAFYDSGYRHVDLIWTIVQRELDPGFNPQNAMDFGCGVGRILVPLAERCNHVVGVDVSETMLAEAVLNCERVGVTNHSLMTLSSISDIQKKFDFIHSYIVFQHIPAKRGEKIFAGLLSSLSDDGIGAFHFTYVDQSAWKIRAYNWCRQTIPCASTFFNIVKNRSWHVPHVHMNAYNLSRLIELLYEHGCQHVYALLDGTPGMQLGIFLFFKKTCHRYPDWRTAIEHR